MPVNALEQQSPPIPSQINDDWRLYPILEKSMLEKSQTSPESALESSSVAQEADPHIMTWQHSISVPVSDVGCRATQKGEDIKGAEPMDLTPDEAWWSESGTPSPSPSFPSPAESPPQTDSSDWLGGVHLWQAQRKYPPGDAPIASCAQAAKTLHPQPQIGTTPHNTGGSAGRLLSASNPVYDTVEQLLAIDAASAAAAAGALVRASSFHRYKTLASADSTSTSLRLPPCSASASAPCIFPQKRTSADAKERG